MRHRRCSYTPCAHCISEIKEVQEIATPVEAAAPGTGEQQPAAAAVPEEKVATPVDEEDEDEEDDANDGCGFCLFMRGGGCKKAFNVSGTGGCME